MIQLLMLLGTLLHFVLFFGPCIFNNEDKK